MGRPRIKNKAYPRTVSFSYKPSDVFKMQNGESMRAETIMEQIDDISDRENTSRSQIIMKAIAEYWEEHIKGNYQHTMNNFMEGGEESYRQLEQNIITYLVEKERDIKGTEIWGMVKELDFSPTKRKKSVEIIARRLRYLGVKVWL